jgi:hypothetical protein
MAVSEVNQYALDLGNSLQRILGPGAPTAEIAAFTTAAQHLADITAAPPDAASWDAAIGEWRTAREALTAYLQRYLLEGLPDIPSLHELADKLNWDSSEGLAGELPLGPLKLRLATSSLTLQPKLPNQTVLPAITLGPYKPSGLSVALASPIGKDLPGGGSIMRLSGTPGFGGTLSVPLGAVSVDAAAILERMPDGAPSFLAVMGASFNPPIQLSFGFSLDRVGGIIGVHRIVDTNALSVAVRTGAAGDTLFATRPPPSPVNLIDSLRRFLPSFYGRHLLAPTLRLAWLSLGTGNFLSLDLGIIVEIPSGKVTVLGVARAQIPGTPGLIQLRLDVIGIVDPSQSQVSIDATLVDSHVLGIFSVYGDAALRMNWGSQAYTVMSIGGFYPGFNPEPAQLPAMRRVGLALDAPTGGLLDIHADGYLAVTTNTIQLGGRLDISISMGLSAHGFLQLDALVQFRPFSFIATASAGFDVRAGSFSFGGVRLDGLISGPGPLVIRGKLTIETFLFDLSWDETFTIGSGPGDMAPKPDELLAIMQAEIACTGNLRATSMDDPAVILAPRALRTDVAAVPPTGTLEWAQHRAPLGFPIDRVDGLPLPARKGVRVTTAGGAVKDKFAPGNYCNLTSAEQLNRPPFDLLDAGLLLDSGASISSAALPDNRTVDVVILPDSPPAWIGQPVDLSAISDLVNGSQRPPALGDETPLIQAQSEVWTTVPRTAFASYASATAAHAFAKGNMTGGAVPMTEFNAPVDLAGV